MLLHNFPFFIRQFSGLEQNLVRHAHLANIVQQRAAPDVDQVLAVGAHLAASCQRQFGHALAVALGLVIAQIQRLRPAFNGGVVGHLQFHVRLLQIHEEMGLAHRDCRLACQRLEEIDPILTRVQRLVQKYLQRALDFILGDQWRGKVSGKIFAS